MGWMSPSELLDYEIRASWWAAWVSWPPLQEIVSQYFAWKTRRKYNRYVTSLKERARVRMFRSQVRYKEEE